LPTGVLCIISTRQQFDRLDQIFIEYIREKYAENPAQAEQIAQKAAHYFPPTSINHPQNPKLKTQNPKLKTQN
jgi:hypothetical protein